MTAPELDRRALPTASFPTADGWCAAECVNADGSVSYWLVGPDDGAAPGCADRKAAPHEQTGRLPAEYRRRLGFQCSARTATGRRCSNTTAEVDGLCPAHRPRRAEL